MRRLAKRIGLRAPSIYKHLPGSQALEAAIIISEPTEVLPHDCVI
jgi:hypothetical protein